MIKSRFSGWNVEFLAHQTWQKLGSPSTVAGLHITFAFRFNDRGYHHVRQGIRYLEAGLLDACLSFNPKANLGRAEKTCTKREATAAGDKSR